MLIYTSDGLHKSTPDKRWHSTARLKTAKQLANGTHQVAHFIPKFWGSKECKKYVIFPTIIPDKLPPPELEDHNKSERGKKKKKKNHEKAKEEEELEGSHKSEWRN